MSNGLFDSIFSGTNGLANQLVTDYGPTATISYESGSTYDPVTMSESVAGTETSYSTSITPPRPYNKNEINDSTILTGDMETIIPEAQTPEQPPVGAACTFNNEKFRVMNVQPILSGDDTAAYRLQLRRL